MRKRLMASHLIAVYLKSLPHAMIDSTITARLPDSMLHSLRNCGDVSVSEQLRQFSLDQSNWGCKYISSHSPLAGSIQSERLLTKTETFPITTANTVRRLQINNRKQNDMKHVNC